MHYFPATVIEEINELGRRSYAVRYADGRVIHRGYRYYEHAEAFLQWLINYAGRA